MYKLLALDMDGTLLRSDKTISEKTLDAIKKAREKGVKIVLATGRPVHGILSYIEQLGLNNDDEFVVTFNGCTVQTAKSGEILFEISVKGEDLHYLYEISKNLNIDIHAFTSPEFCITPKINEYSLIEARINKIDLVEKDFYDIKPEEEVIKVLMVASKENLDAAYSKLPEEAYEKYSVMRSSDIFLEFLSKGINKSRGIDFLANKLNIKREEIICIGDAENDIAMIEYAGLGVAMGNAFTKVKKASNYITFTNDEDGVAHVIDKFVLSEPVSS
ncbi:sugar-phosphatase [Clostridium sp. 19966]|uniref:sugar-phosphatase n=1 Tax=Clostridium sp. 19966 TaxID=2768166 RepID=UPI0028E09DDA|nr:sugar-phosphatase [Clostridium sp. 19966]MDT8718696.1 sugar-phosphatase [Clostridium sp. 19966]